MKTTWFNVRTSLFAFCLMWLMHCPAEPVMIAYTNASWLLPHWSRFIDTDEYLSIKGWVLIRSKRSFIVDPSAEYELSGSFRTPGYQKKDSHFEFGFIPIDENRDDIPMNAVSRIRNTLTTLAADAKIGDTVLELSSTTGWNGDFIAFNARDDERDLPNHDVMRIHHPKNHNELKRHTVTLENPLKNAYPKGTMVRCHNQSTRLWTVNRFKTAGRTWTPFSGKIRGIGYNQYRYDQWWPGTVRARIFLLIPGNTILEFKDIKVTKKCRD